LHKNLGATMIYVTHDQTEAMTMGDKIVILKDGEVQQIGVPMDLYVKPINRFVAGFIGSPAMNFINGKIELSDKMYFVIDQVNSKIELDQKYMNTLSKYQNKEITIGIRPEDLLFSNEKSSMNEILVNLEIAEPMGNETLLYFTLQGAQMIARSNPNQYYKAGDAYFLSVDKNKIHFFDKENGTAI
jgi:multiple sugar transport system ATP-binding protein